MSPESPHADVVVVGAGPAGLAAAQTTAAAGLQTRLVERMVFGGELANIARIHDLPGHEGITGTELTDRLLDGVEAAGVQIVLGTVERLHESDGSWTVVVDGEALRADGVILAAGTSPRQLGLDGEEGFAGRGVATCALCDGPLLQKRPVAVVGSDRIALSECEILADFADRVYLIAETEVSVTDRYWAREILARPNVEVLTGATVTGLIGDDRLTHLDVTSAGTSQRLAVDALFPATRSPSREAPEVAVGRADDGAVLVRTDLSTDRPGLYAAGDYRCGSAHVVAAALGDGVAAGRGLTSLLTRRAITPY